MGLADRDYMRHQPAPAAQRQRPRRLVRTAVATHSPPPLIVLVVSVAATLAFSHLSWLRAQIPTTKASPPREQVIPVRVWVPAARHGHVKTVQVRVRWKSD